MKTSFSKKMWVHVSTNVNLNTLNEHIIKIIMKYIEFQCVHPSLFLLITQIFS